MTHRYTLLVGGIVISGRDEPDASAIAWAEGTVIAIGSDSDVIGISRGDSRLADLSGAHVLPLGDEPDASWQTAATLEIGGRADLAVVEGDPRRLPPGVGRLRATALIRGGHVVAGKLPRRAGDGERA